jgi:hypothetical protein
MKMQVEASRLLIWRAAVDAEQDFPSISSPAWLGFCQ